MNVCRRFTRLIQAVLSLSLFFTFFHAASAAHALPVVKPVYSCAEFGALKFSKGIDADVKILGATELNTAQGTFCKISATLGPDIGVEVALPQSRWTQRLLQVGCGGLCGDINLSLSNASGCVPAMNGEFAVAATNMGHAGSMMDASWAEDPQKRIDFAYRANHVTAQLTKALIKAYYGQQQKFAYFMGCSDGGREALAEAQRYPHDFNGISAGAPAAWFSMQNAFFHGWNVIANLRADGTPILLQNRLALIHQAAMAHCPSLSGSEDDVLQNPYACTFSRSWIKPCTSGQKDRSHCLTTEELDVVEKLYHGARGQNGEQYAPGGLPIGSELRWPVPATPAGHSMSEMMALPALQYVLLPGGKQKLTKVADFAFTRQNFARVAELAPLYNATNTNLAPFKAAGGKLIVWHGLADDSISPAGTIAYFKGVQAFMGAEKVDSFMRLFLLPGVAHCGNGEGPDQIDLLTALINWTEQGVAPDKLIAGKTENAASPPGIPPAQGIAEPKPASEDASVQFHGVQKPSQPVAGPASKVVYTRPVFPYPYVAEYNGKGDASDAASYHAVVSQDDEKLDLHKPISDMLGPDNQLTYKVNNGQLTVQQ
ncbi:tannase/feruloyl esterase family alpha/beta hydrolase [Pantoea sp. AS142]|uniref:tannase/feruloyl esterase family alpha/beta hydrolase n=1 Tax=Pantoea sp. AS142 TaxID=3081292 RepID=UPI003015960E